MSEIVNNEQDNSQDSIGQKLEKVSSTSCIHHWIIESPNGASSMGVCKICGMEKEFRNSYEYSSWHGPKPSS